MQNKYEILDIVGEGAFGIVMRCKNKETGEIVAIKKFKNSEDDLVQKSMLRELKVLKKLKHENIIQMKECFRRKGKLYLVFEYIEKNLLQIIEDNTNGLDQNLVKKIMYQICKAVIYIHSNETLHRDIKPENVLITNEFLVKICDFGFARVVPQKGGVLTDYVATRWYRAPELLVGCPNYGKEVDYWAIGCIMGELTDGQPMFPSETEFNQLIVIQKLLGTLPQSQFEIFYSNPRYAGEKLDSIIKAETLERKYFGKMNKTALNFLKALLKLDPRDRLCFNDVILHPYFDELRLDDPEFYYLFSKPSNGNKGLIQAQNTHHTQQMINTKTLNVNSNTALSNKNITSSNINIVTNKFQSSKTNFYNNGNFSKSPPKESVNSNIKPGIKFPKKININHEANYNGNLNLNNNQNLNNVGLQKTGFKTFYNINENKDDVYNFDIDSNFNLNLDENANNYNLTNRGYNNLNTNQNSTVIVNNKKRKNNNIANLDIIQEEVNNLNSNINFNKKLNETRLNRFKAENGVDINCEEEYINNVNNVNNMVNYVHNNPGNHFNNKKNKIIIKEESPDSRNVLNLNTNSTLTTNFLPNITFHRAFEDLQNGHNKKIKK